MPPGQITLLKGVIVCNTSLAVQAIRKLDVLPLIRHNDHANALKSAEREVAQFDELLYQDSVSSM